MIYNVQQRTTNTLFTIDGEWHAPNWTPKGQYIVSDMGGELYRIPVSGSNAGKPEKINVSLRMMITNDHALSWDGKQIAVTGITPPMPAKIRTPADIHNPLFLMKVDGTNTHEVHLGWLHGWSPDGKYVVYTQYHENNFDIYRISADGSGELLMTTNSGQDDGPEYSADGKWVYLCSNRSGKWDGWRMPAGGAGPDDKLAEKITNGVDTQDWFPHISPDGQWLYTISYPIDHPVHTLHWGRHEDQATTPGKRRGRERRWTNYGEDLLWRPGLGQYGGWAPDSKRFAWTEYETLPEHAGR